MNEWVLLYDVITKASISCYYNNEWHHSGEVNDVMVILISWWSELSEKCLYRTYLVGSEDTLDSVARLWKIKIQKIVVANHYLMRENSSNSIHHKNQH